VAISAQQRGSAGSARNYQQLVSTYGPHSTTVTDAPPFVAKDVFDKVLFLSVLAIVSGTVVAIAKPAPGLMWMAWIVALGAGLIGALSPPRARVCAPVYAVAMGAALGWISEYYASRNGAVVPLAVLGTTGIFFGVLAMYRTGLVRVTRRFWQVTLVATIGLLAMALAVMFGLTIPYTSQQVTYLVVFGFLYLSSSRS
jgi:uncharacterized YccA/Bax inhibitor family protein